MLGSILNIYKSPVTVTKLLIAIGIAVVIGILFSIVLVIFFGLFSQATDELATVIASIGVSLTALLILATLTYFLTHRIYLQLKGVGKLK